MSGDQQLRAFIERILRLKEEQDTLAADIREVYAEAKGSGFDKTAMGEVVAYLRKIEKKGMDAVSERTALFDLYLNAYERPSHAHTREGQSYAEEKGRGVDAAFVNSILVGGEITDNQASDQPDEAVVPATAAVASDEQAAQDDVGATASSTYSKMDRATEGSFETGSVAAENARKAGPDGADGSVSHAGAGESPATNSNSQPTKGESDAKSAHDDSVYEKLLIFSTGLVSGAAMAAEKETGNTAERQPPHDLQNAPVESAADTISAIDSNSQRPLAADSAGEAGSSSLLTSPAANYVMPEIPAFLDRRGELTKTSEASA